MKVRKVLGGFAWAMLAAMLILVFNKSRGCYSKFCNVLNKKGYGLFTLRVVILNHEINKHRREWLCIY